MSEPFEHRLVVRFNDVDHAKVVYYPKYLDYCHEAFEEFMRAGTGEPYADTVNHLGVGYPAVHADVHYRAPARFGDELTIRVTCIRLGTKSVRLRYEIDRVGDGARVADADVTTSAIDMARFVGVPIPAEHRAMFAAHRHT